MKANPPILILWTCANIEEARRICQSLVEQKLVACANLIPQIESIYFWEGKIESSNEVKVFLKTLDSHFENVKEHIKKHCSYEVPEISKILFDGGNSEYFSWIEKTTGSI